MTHISTHAESYIAKFSDPFYNSRLYLFGKEDVSSAQLSLRGGEGKDIFKLRPKHEAYCLFNLWVQMEGGH